MASESRTDQAGLSYGGETAARGPVPPNPVPTGQQPVSSRRWGHAAPPGTPGSFFPRGLRLMFPQSTRLFS